MINIGGYSECECKFNNIIQTRLIIGMAID